MSERTFTVSIDCDSDALMMYPEAEVARILHATAYNLETGACFETWRTLYDVNGNAVGRAGFHIAGGEGYTR